MAISESACRLNPVIKELSCKRKIGNAHDAHAWAMRNIIDEEDIKLLDVFQAKYLPAPDMRGSIFIRRGS